MTPPTPGDIGAFVIHTSYEYEVTATDLGVDYLSMTCVGTETGLEPSVKVKPKGKNQYSATVMAEKPDKYIVDILWGGEHVPSSPCTLNVEGHPHADRVLCDGPHYTVGSLDPVILNADVENSGAGELRATCVGDKFGSIQVDIAEREPKKYCVSFTPPGEDIFSLSVLWQLESVKDSPFKVNTISPDALKCLVSEPQIPLDPSEPIVVYVDASNAGNGELTALALGDETGEKDVDIKEMEDNKFVLSFVPELADFYTMNVKWAGADVPG